MDAARQSGTTDLSWRDLLVLIRDAQDDDGRPRLRVIARKEWLFDPDCASRQRIQHGLWHAEFDSAIRQMAEDDQSRAVEEKRVLVAKPERGWDWAREQIDGKTRAFQLARIHYAKRRLPPGLLDKADKKAGTEIDKVGVVLRDVRNHEDALAAARAAFPVEPSIYGYAIPAISQRPAPKRDRRAKEEFTPEGISNAIRVAHSLSRSRLRTADEIMKMLGRPDVKEMRVELKRLMAAPNAGEKLLNEIERGNQAISWAEALAPKSTYHLVQSLSGLAVVMASLVSGLIASDPSAVPRGTRDLSLWLWDNSEGLLQKLSFRPAPNYTGPRLPFFVAYDRTDPTYSQINKVLETLRQLISEGKIR